MCAQWAPPCVDANGNAPWWIEYAGDGWYRCALCPGKPWLSDAESHFASKIHVKKEEYENDRVAALAAQHVRRQSARPAGESSGSQADGSAAVTAPWQGSAPQAAGSAAVAPPPPPPGPPSQAADSAAVAPPPPPPAAPSKPPPLAVAIEGRLAVIEEHMATSDRLGAIEGKLAVIQEHMATSDRLGAIEGKLAVIATSSDRFHEVFRILTVMETQLAVMQEQMAKLEITNAGGDASSPKGSDAGEFEKLGDS